jgi:DNA-binding NarL/FixJ family response regulator
MLPWAGFRDEYGAKAPSGWQELQVDIRVLLADDHAVVRDGIKSVIEKMGKGITVVGEAADGRELLELAKTVPADVYVMDIAMPHLSGMETMERLLKKDTQAKVLILSMYYEKILVERAFKSGARGYLIKESASEEIIRAIREVHQGRYYLSPRISGYLVQGFLNPDSRDSGKLESALTSRQREILMLISEGLTEKEIARQLNISVHTVHVHKNNIMEKLDIHTKAGLIKYALKMGMVQL